MGLHARQPRLHQLSRPGRRLARLRLGLAGRECTHRVPSTPTQRAGGPTPGRPRWTVPRVSEWEGGGVSAGAGTEQIPQKAKRGEGGAAVGTDQTRAGSPCLAREQPPGAPDTPTAPAARASPPGRPEGDGEAGSGRAGSGAPGAGRKRARDAGGSAHLAVGVPVRPAAALPRPRAVPGAGQPRARRMDGRRRRRRRPAPVLQGSRCAGVPRPAARAASGWGARGELWLGVCDRESRDPRSLRPSSLPHSRPPAVIWGRSCRPLAVASGSTGPQPTRTSQRAPCECH